MVNLNAIYVTQRKLRNIDQLQAIVCAIENEEFLPPVRLAEFEDGSIHVEDGHHRCLSYLLSGRNFLEDYEYILVLKYKVDRIRFGKLVDLHERIFC